MAATTSREALTLNQSESSISYGKTKGYFISKTMIFILSGLFVSVTVATGLLVYYYAPDIKDDPVLPNDGHGSPSTTPAPKESINLRLPSSLTPLHYSMKLQPFLFTDFSLKGSVEIDFKVEEETTNITLHILDIITHNDTVKVTPLDDLTGPGVEITEHLFDPMTQFYTAQLSEALEAGKEYRLAMDYTGYLNDKLTGFYRSVYNDEDGNKRYLAATQFEATDARRAFPCFDEPALKATFQINIVRPGNMSSIANMPLNSTTKIEGEDDMFLDVFQTTKKMSTYLVAFVVSDFVFMNSTENDHVLFRVWARKGAIDQGTYALDKGPEVLLFYENYFDVPFPLPKQDMIALPDFSAGAMENWGLVTYRETALLFDPEVSSASNKQRVAVVIAHELAHQWFGNLVSPVWWSQLWLNEGFASFMEYLGTNAIEPDWKMLEQFLTRLHSVFTLDCLETSHPISVEVDNPSEINQLFDGISYDKGASIIRMMNHFLTEDTFKAGLHNYLEALSYANADQDGLWQYLTEQAHTDGVLPDTMTVKQIMDTWTLQKGYPVLDVTIQDNLAVLTQQKFTLIKYENSTDAHDYKWWIPLNYATKSNPVFDNTKPTKWLADNEDGIDLEGEFSAAEWALFNIQETGFYRVNYNEENWAFLITQLNDNFTVIHSSNRAQLLDDSLNLAKAGQLSYNIALDVVSYLKTETDYVPWDSAFLSLSYIEQMFTRTSGYGQLKKYYMSMLEPLYQDVGFDDQLNDPLLEQYKRSLATSWVCKLDYEDCVTRSTGLYEQWMDNPTNLSIISPNQKSTVYCTSIREGGETEWDFAWNQYLESNVAFEKDRILSSLGCSKEIWILSRYLDMAFTAGSGIRRQDALRVFSSIAKNDNGRDLAWNYVKENWKKVSDYFGTFTSLGDMITIVSSEFNTNEELDELELFKEQHIDSLEGATLAIDQSIERTRNNIAWMQSNYDVIVQWLNDHGYSKKLASEKTNAGRL